LIVEDESIEAMNFEQSLKSFGYEVVGIVSNGKDAVNKAASFKPDLILMDIVLKGDMDGIEAAGYIKEEFDIPIVYLTAHPEQSAIDRAKLTSPYGYLIKPVSKTDLKNTIELALYKNQMEVELRKSEKKYRNLYSTMSEGVAVHKIIYDNHQDPVDYIILDVNPSYEEIIGLKKEDILNKKASEAYGTGEAPFLDKYSNVANTRESLQFESYFEPMDKYFNISVFSPAKGFFATVFEDITQRKKVEKTIFESEQKYSHLFDSVPVGISISDINSEVLDVNKAMTDISGYTLEEYKNININEIYDHPEKDRMPLLKKLEAEGKLLDYEVKLKRKDGSNYFALLNSEIIEMGGEKVVISTTRDITNRKKAEKALKESEEDLRFITNNMTDIIGQLNVEGIITYFSPSVKQLTGYEPQEMVGKGTSELVHPEDKERVLNAIQEGILNRKTLTVEYRTKISDGSYLWVESNGKAVYDADGNFKSLIFVVRDISDRKKVENELKESEQKYKTLFDSDPDYTILAGLDGVILDVNTAAELVRGLSKEEMVGKYFSELKIFPEEDLSLHQEMYSHLLKENYVAPYESRIYDKNGKIRWVKTQLTSIWKKDKPDSILIINSDIDKRKKAEKAVKESEAYYRTIFAHSGTATLILEENNIISRANKESEKLSGYSRKDIEGKKRWTDFVVQEDLEMMENYHKKRRENSKTVPKAYDFRLINKNGQIKNIHLDIGLIPGTKESVASLNDFTQLRNAENKIKQSLKENEVINQVIIQLLKSKDTSEIYSIIGKSIKNLLPSSYVLITASDTEMKNFHIIKAFGLQNKINKLNKILGTDIYQIKFPTFSLTEEDLEKFHSAQLISFDGLYDVAVRKIPRPICKIIEKVFNVGKIYSIGFSREDIIYGSLIIILPKGQKLENKDAIETILHQGSITIQRQTAEEMIKTSLKEKEVLLREIHHRVKNNLQIISSLLDLQEDYVSEDATAVNVLKESQNRVLSMAMIHEMIYQSEDLSNINFSDYIRNLTSNLFNSYGAKSNITSLINVKQIYLNIETSIPLGLLITELISNSLKYAFPNYEEGNISIEMQSRNNEYKLKITDNGIGIPKNIDFNTESTLGLRLVKSLVNQLDGTIQLDRTQGTQYTMTFKELTYKKRI
jgi:PAS domain S-box-containing protein